MDVSIQQSIIVTTLNAPAFWELNNQILHRAGQFRVGISTTVNLRQTWACKDGYIAFQLNGGSVGAKTNRRLVKWMDEEGMASDFLKNFDWANYNIAETTLESQESLEKPIIRFFESHTMTELYEGAIKRDIQLFPVFLPKDLIGSPQLEARNFWVNLEHPELDSTITYPGAFIKLSETPCLIRRRAPRIGEHNLEVYQQLGLCKEELVRLKRTGVV